MEYFLKSKPALLALLASLTISCASTSELQDSEASRPVEPITIADMQELEAQVQERPMDPATLEKLLEAEFAGYRGDAAAVVDLYLKAARETHDPAILARTVQLAIEISDLDRAMQAAVLWHETDPESREARALAVQMLARNREVEAAWLITEEASSPALVRLVATETVSTENLAQILWLGQQIEEFGGDKAPHTELYLAQAILLNQLEREDQALELARQSLLLDSDNIGALLLITELLLKNERDQEAAIIVENWLDTNWQRTDVDRASLLSVFLEINREAADASVSRLYAQHPESNELLLIAAEIKMNTRQLDAAERLYRIVVELPEHEDLANLQLGRIHHFRTEIELALENYAKVPPGVYYQYAQDQVVSLLSETGRVDELIVFFADQRRSYPDIEERLFVTQNQYLNAVLDDYRLLDFLNEALQTYPINADLLYSRSLVGERIGRLDISEADLRTIIAEDKNNSNALNALGYTLTNRTDRHAEAYELIEQALSLDPESPAILDSMGWVLHNLGESEEALEYLIQAQNSLFDPEVISHHAEVLWHLDRTDEALDLIGVAMLEFPGNALLNNIRQRILDDLDNS
jgi:tetratricopeptide (TPR) repeat protein